MPISTRICLLSIAILLIPIIGYSTTYYSKLSGNANTLSTWGTNTDGTGTAPGNFTTSGDIFILRTGSTLGLSGQWTIASGVTLQVDGNISVTTNNHDINISGTVIFTNTSATQVSLTGGGNGNSFIVSGAATVKTNNVNGLKGTNCSLPATASGTITLNANANYEFTGSAAQLTTGLPASVNDLVVNSSSEVNVSTSTTISGQLKLQSGILSISPGVTLTVPNVASLVGSGFSSSKHINTKVSGSSLGYLRINSINGTASFPVGNGTYYLPASITTTSSTDIRINVFQGITKNGLPNGTPFATADKAGIVDAVWNIERMSGVSLLLITLNWPQVLEGSSFSGFSNADIGISLNHVTYWDLPIGTGNQAANTATLSSVSTLGAFGVGKVGIALPIKFGTISVNKLGSVARIKWNTLTEIDIRKFAIERSVNGIDFDVIGEQVSLAAPYEGHSYEYADLTPLAGNSFYRIKAINNDGKVDLSTIIRLSNSTNADAVVTVYPNPSPNKLLNVQASGLKEGRYQLVITDISGKPVLSDWLNVTGSFYGQQVRLPAGTPKGSYLLKLIGQGTEFTKVLMVI